MPAPDRHSKAFTLVELLVVIAITALLVSLAVVGYGRVRQSSAEVKSLANLRTLSTTFEVYAARYSSYPWGQGGWGRPPSMGDPWAISFSVWDCERFWPVLFHDDSPWMENYRAWLSPGADPSRFTSVWEGSSMGFAHSYLSSYSYSQSFLAEHSNWEGVTNASTKPIRPDQVAHPSAKVLLFDIDRAYLRKVRPADLRPMVFADSSASLRQDSAAVAPVRNMALSEPPRRYHDTPSGVRGRDF